MSQNRHDHPAGAFIDRHRHDDHQLIYVSRGVLAVQTARGAWVASSARAIWIPAAIDHEHRVFGQSSIHTLRFPLSDQPFPLEAPTIVAVNGLLRELLMACTEPDLPAAEAQRLRAVVHDRLARARIQPLALPVAEDPRLADVCRLVTDDLRLPRSAAWLATQVGASERTIARLFRAEFGTTYPQWRTTTRVFHAMIRLAEGATVTDAAHTCGWATTSAFIAAFTRTMGQTPGAYRAAAGVVAG